MNNARSHPFHLHLARSLLHLAKHTRAYIPLAPHLVPVLAATLSPAKLKASTLRPLDLELQLRAPQQYARTRVYAEGVREEAALLLGEWLAAPGVHASAAFPELVVPALVLLRRAAKGARDAGAVKTLLERVEEGARWVEQRRAAAAFAPADTRAVAQWEAELEAKLGESPLVKYLKVQRKAREKRRQLVEKARKGEDEMLDED
ncbi:nucleolar complex protein 2 [Schizophyllum fasciatum]